jgi:hypothetical protein
VSMLHSTTSVGREVMQDVQRMITDSETMDELCKKLAQYWGADEQALQTAAVEWKERASTRQARADRASRMLQLGRRWSGEASKQTSQEDTIRESRQIKLELLVEQIAAKVFPI